MRSISPSGNNHSRTKNQNQHYMAEQGQTPPKGKVDVFDVMKQYKDGGLGIDPTPSFRYMDQLVRAGEVDVQVDDAISRKITG